MPDREHDDLVARISAGASGIHADPSASEQISGAVVRRQRRRAATTTLVSATVVVLVAIGAAVVVPRVVSPTPEPAAPDRTEQADRPSAVTEDTYRPAGFFSDVVGGRAVPTITRFRAAPGEKFFARFDWYPPGATSDPFLGAIALERFGGTPGQTCGELLGGTPRCEETDDGSVLATYEIPAADGFFDPVHEGEAIVFPATGQTVRGVVYLRADGLAVSTLICDCSADAGAVLADEPPLNHDQLEEVVTDESWAEQVDG